MSAALWSWGAALCVYGAWLWWSDPSRSARRRRRRTARRFVRAAMRARGGPRAVPDPIEWGGWWK